jgi:hypothetical protein
MCKCFSPTKKAPISYSSCKTTYFYAKKRSLRAIIWTKIEGEIFFSFGPDWPLSNSKHHTICASVKKYSYILWNMPV